MASKVLDSLRAFARTYRDEAPRAIAKDTRSYSTLSAAMDSVNEFIRQLSFQGPILKVDASFGAGNAPYYTWIAAFDPRVSSGATNGFYVVLLFSDDLTQLVISLNQGSTVAEDATIKEMTPTVNGGQCRLMLIFL